MSYKQLFLTLLLLMAISNQAKADDIYVSYKWAASGAKNFTESWKVMTTDYDTRTPEGMVMLINELASLQKVKTVVIYYIRTLKEGEVLPETSSGELTA